VSRRRRERPGVRRHEAAGEQHQRDRHATGREHASHPTRERRPGATRSVHARQHGGDNERAEEPAPASGRLEQCERRCRGDGRGERELDSVVSVRASQDRGEREHDPEEGDNVRDAEPRVVRCDGPRERRLDPGRVRAHGDADRLE
jgi:hypothetical protein